MLYYGNVLIYSDHKEDSFFVFFSKMAFFVVPLSTLMIVEFHSLNGTSNIDLLQLIVTLEGQQKILNLSLPSTPLNPILQKNTLKAIDQAKEFIGSDSYSFILEQLSIIYKAPKPGEDSVILKALSEYGADLNEHNNLSFRLNLILTLLQYHRNYGTIRNGQEVLQNTLFEDIQLNFLKEALLAKGKLIQKTKSQPWFKKHLTKLLLLFSVISITGYISWQRMHYDSEAKTLERRVDNAESLISKQSEAMTLQQQLFNDLNRQLTLSEQELRRQATLFAPLSQATSQLQTDCRNLLPILAQTDSLQAILARMMPMLETHQAQLLRLEESTRVVPPTVATSAEIAAIKERELASLRNRYFILMREIEAKCSALGEPPPFVPIALTTTTDPEELRRNLPTYEALLETKERQLRQKELLRLNSITAGVSVAASCLTGGVMQALCTVPTVLAEPLRAAPMPHVPPPRTLASNPTHEIRTPTASLTQAAQTAIQAMLTR